ncbi:MAG: hypothetical protein Q8919_08350 [Bacteroidota bacterium]|nr:hypothetical protein [Bacteroidota bacterium]
MTSSDTFIDYPYELFSYMREIHKPVFHNSNVFLRDLQFSIQDYFEDREGKTIRDADALRMAEEISRAYERKGIFRKVNPQGFVLNFPELITSKEGNTRGGLSGELPDQMPPPKAAAPAPAPKAAAPAAAPKPAAAAPAAPKPAAAPAAAGAVPAGAKAPPPWLKK